jgi:ketosteroid isomerase-like protein
MGEHANADIVRRMNEAIAAGDMQTAAAFVADDVVWHQIGAAEPVRGKAQLAASMAGFAEAAITYDIHDILASDEHVIALGTANATIGDRSLTYRTAEIYHMADGQVTERWAFSDDTKAITDFFG